VVAGPHRREAIAQELGVRRLALQRDVQRHGFIADNREYFAAHLYHQRLRAERAIFGGARPRQQVGAQGL